MAILSGGPNSGFSGKAGSVVGYYRLGKWVIRALPKLSPKNKKGSADQNFHRGKLRAVQHFLKPILPFIRVGFNLESKRRGNTAHNSASSWNMLNAFGEDGQLDYSKTRVSMGSLTGPQAAAVTASGSDLIFTWSDNSDAGDLRASAASSDDQVMLLAYNIQTGEVELMLSGARRSACTEKLKLSSGRPQNKNEWHTWIAFISDDRESISNSEYLGRLTVDS